MSHQQTSFVIRRQTDRQLFAGLALMRESVQFSECQTTLLFPQSTIEGWPENSEELTSILSADTVSTRVISVTHGNISLQIERPLDPQQRQAQKLLGMTDIVRLSSPKAADIGAATQLLSLARQHLGAVDQKEFIEYLQEEDQAFYAARESSIQSLQDMQENFFEKIQEFTTQQADRYQQLERDLEQDAVRQREQLQAEYEKKAKDLATQEKELENRASELDDRESKFVRREIRKELKKVIEDRGSSFELTKGAKRRRLFTTVTYVALLLIFLVAAGYFMVNDTSASMSAWHIIRQCTFSLAFAVTAGFFLRWTATWANQHADEEFKLKRLELDIDRASWVVEMALEWASEREGAEIPEFLVDRLSRNLFTEDRPTDTTMSAGDALASAIFQNAKAAKLRVGDSEIELEQKGIRSLGKTPAKNDSEGSK